MVSHYALRLGKVKQAFFKQVYWFLYKEVRTNCPQNKLALRQRYIETNKPPDTQANIRTHRLEKNQNTDKHTYTQRDTQVARALM